MSVIQPAKETNMNKLTEWCINKIERDYPDDIALLIGVRGHSTNGDGHGEVFDYFVPCTDRGYELSRAFIVEGIGHDLYPRSFERLEGSADLDEMISVLKNGFILYARTPEDETRFIGLQEKLRKNLADSSFTYKKAVEYVHSAEDVFSTLMFEDRLFRARNEVCGILKYISSAIAFINGSSADEPLFSEAQTYEVCSEDLIYGCANLLEVPDGFFKYAGDIIHAGSIEDCRHIAENLIRTARQFLAEHKVMDRSDDTADIIDYNDLAGWYQEMSLTWHRLRYYTENNMIEKAYCDACYLQSELIAISPEFNIPEYNLLDSFDASRPELVRIRADRIEQEIRRVITDNGVKIDEFATLEDFLKSEKESL